MIKIVVGGAYGRVGRCIVQLVQEDPQTQLVASVIRTLGLASIHTPFDVFIDFSSTACLDEHLALCSEQKKAMVIGVTGLSQSQKEHLVKASQVIPIMYSPNMSIGVNISFKLLEVAAKVLNENVENVGVAIQEIHHQHKKDIPSGTALKMGEIIAETWGKTLPVPEISFASSRVAEVMGDHSVLFALADERLEINHRAENRSLFARGAVRAAKWLVHQPPGLYDMQDVLSLK